MKFIIFLTRDFQVCNHIFVHTYILTVSRLDNTVIISILRSWPFILTDKYFVGYTYIHQKIIIVRQSKYDVLRSIQVQYCMISSAGK